MKTNGNRILIITILLYFFVVVLSFTTLAQPDYDFTNGSLVSGTDNQTGAVYRFTSVKPGVDALVTITAITGGISLNNVDGASGFKEAFQPVIQVPANSKGYAEFRFDFVAAGTSNPMVMLEVPATCIDVDGIMSGGFPVNEFDMVSTSAGYYVDFNQLGGELAIGFNTPGWVTGNNVATIDYPGVDTVARQAMFSVISGNISTLTIRVGADNKTSSSQQRLRSVYFKKFSYPNSFLARPALVSFRGTRSNDQVNLQWLLEKENNLSRIIIERSDNGHDYSEIAEIWRAEVSADMPSSYSDANQLPQSYYRLRMVSVNGEVTYSQILSFRTAVAGRNEFKMYPSAFHGTATISLESGARENAVFQLLDFSGKAVSQQQVRLEEGTNTIQLDGFHGLATGQYIAVLKTSGKVYSQKVIKQ